ncbi:hypothetical protein [Prescottella equi]|uniref:hypothetical protein n=1 Tax=Rhodococcus hoagii TaxID=43767 RepID=UPI00111C0BF3|nr:hypothetical protein [Prescottella equi]
MGLRVFVAVSNELCSFDFHTSQSWTIDDELGRLHVHSADGVNDVAVFDSWSCVTRIDDDGEADG